MNDKKIRQELTQDDKGQLFGGYALQSSSRKGLESQFLGENGNCKGGGWFDTNVNCNRCASCDQLGGMDDFQPAP